MAKKIFTGQFIREVWDWRLSIGNPILYADGDTWVVRIWANQPANGERELLEEYVTDIPTDGGIHDHAAIAECYKWLYSMRDKYARDNIEDLKPLAAQVNKANEALAAAMKA